MSKIPRDIIIIFLSLLFLAYLFITNPPTNTGTVEPESNPIELYDE